jgi:hypothetical protein
MSNNVIRPKLNGVFPILPDGLHNVALGNGTQYEVCIIRTERGIVFGILGRGCYEFDRGSHDVSYVIEKMNIRRIFIGDAMNFSDLITSQFTQVFTPIGGYQPNLCAK